MKEIRVNSSGGDRMPFPKNAIMFLILGLLILSLLTSCRFSEITDLIHKDTEKFYENYSFSEPLLQKYKINKILFIPYTNQNPEQSYEQKYSTYSLSLASYGQKVNNSKVIVNYVTVEGDQDIIFDKITNNLNESLEFNNDEKQDNMKISVITLFDEINDYNMELTDKSRLKVVLNVTVEENGKSITGDLEYYFETRVRKYLVQP